MKNSYKVVKNTANESNGVVHSWNTYQLIVVRDRLRKSLKEKFPQLSYYHLHIVDTNANIEVGDWFMNSDYPQLCGVTEQGFISDKIVASTDPSLNLPMIPKNFIEAFASNQGIKIADITFFDDKVEITCNDVDLYYTDNSTQKALNWWKNLNSFEQGRLTYLIKDDVYDRLSKKEIEAAYNKYAVSYAIDKLFNTVQAIRDGKSIVKEVESEPEVDFELLKKFIANIDKVDRISTKMAENAILFFNQLKTNPNFAMEVHKRLQ